MTEGVSFGVLTTEGFIPHLSVSGIFLPVKLNVRNTLVREVSKVQDPLKKDGRLVYALPGGGDYIP